MESKQTLWEAFKTVIRGQALSLIAGAKNEKHKDLTNIEGELLCLERDLDGGCHL